MGKVLVLLIVAFVLYFVLKGPAKPKRGGAGDSPKGTVPERVVNCSQCGLYLPESEATREDGHYFCCEEHRRLFAR